ncbi:IS701 family transposase [Streptomyces sp. NBC_01465]|uniref:IS701 family transposase n=1 Tax=Streptomyces sp. NBC_01465 TaxID=2903878 RepID=UPI002E305C28|nr:transposase [Streptomyces sp. NBC_01465]
MAVRDIADIADIRRHARGPRGSDELLQEFVGRLFGDLPRADQLNRAREYVTGLLVTPGKKSLRRMAAAVSESPHTSQALQQFLNSSPWAWHPVRRALAGWTEEHRPTLTWSLGLAVLPKRGDHSAGVHRRFVQDADRTVNCQLGVGLFLGSGDDCIPVDWRLVLPGHWQTDSARRAAVRIPEGEPTPAEGACALDLVRTQTAATGRTDVPLVADLTQLPHDASFLPGLAALGTGFVVRIPASTALRLPAGPGRPVPARQLLHSVTAVTGIGSGVVPDAGGRGHSRVRTCAVRLGHAAPPSPQRPCVLIVEYPAGEHSSPRYYVTDLTHHRPGEILRLAGAAYRTREAVREMQDHYGLLDYEGRSYPGWHRHMTLVSAAHAFRQLSGREPGAEMPGRAGTAKAA